MLQKQEDTPDSLHQQQESINDLWDFPWLVKHLDIKLQKKKRKILMVIDNCPVHHHVRSLKNFELVFLPPNTTCKTQPMDRGIQNFKTHYRKRIILRQMKTIDEEKVFSLSINDAIRLMQQTWDSVKPRTNANCSNTPISKPERALIPFQLIHITGWSKG